MKPEDYQLVCEVFHLASDTSAENRQDLLTEKLAGRADLISQVQLMLDQEDQDALDQPAIEHITIPPAGEMPTMAHAPAQEDTARLSSKEGTPIDENISGYQLEHEIARGGMGVVYKAQQENPSRTVALKMILSGQFASSQEIQRFRMEAEAAANLSHPGIVPIFEVGQHAGKHFFSMGYVPGNSLGDEIKTRKFEPAEAAEMVRQIAEAVQYAHEHEILHRDLKPSNILLGEDGRPQITDFGLAKRMDQNSDLTTTGEIMGSPGYMAPEQASGKIDLIGPGTDIYGLGAILYVLLTGKPPFQAANVIEAIDLVCNADVLPLRKVDRNIPKKLETICLKCLHKVPAARYQTAAELAEDLQAFLDREPIKAKPLTPYERLIYWARRKPGQACTWGAVLLFYIYYIFCVYVLKEPVSTGISFRVYSAVMAISVVAAAWYFQRMHERPHQRTLAIYSWMTLNVTLLTLLLFMTDGVESSLSLIYLLMVAASATMYQKGLVGYVTGICLAGYFIHVLSAFFFPRDNIVFDIHTTVCMSLSILILGMIQYFVVRKVRTQG
ncbi:MAG: serine/threonine protein kinase [Pirellulales bacterium]